MKRKNRRLPIAVASMAAGCTLGLALSGAGAHAQQAPSPAVPTVPVAPAPATPDTATATTPDGLQYDTFFQPFLDDPQYRLKTIAPLTPAPPLFEPYDSTTGLDVYAATSRIASPTRAVVELPVIDAKVGDLITVPLYKVSGPDITGVIARISFPGGVVQPVDTVRAPEWKTASLDFNNRYTGENPERIMAVVTYAPDPLAGNGPLFIMHFRAVKPGEVQLQPAHIDMSDDTYNTVRLVFRNGLIRVRP